MLTTKQRETLLCLIEHQDRNGIPPSFDELCLAIGLKSKSGVHRLLSGLEERGYIRRLHNRARAIDILKYPDGSPFAPINTAGTANAAETTPAETSIPLLGKIAAGTPIAAIAHPSTYISPPTELIGRGEYFALEIEGDSMIEAGILDGDTVLIERREQANNGEIVVALIDEEEATLKRLRRRGESIALEPANTAYETRIFGPDRVRIQGRLAGLIRRY